MCGGDCQELCLMQSKNESHRQWSEQEQILFKQRRKAEFYLSRREKSTKLPTYMGGASERLSHVGLLCLGVL
jgi:hypothetical protein